jgi:short-subunit dehydrogenase
MTRQAILITGASSGLGAGMARVFAAMGRNLALCARRVDRLEELKAELTQQHPDAKIAIAELDVNEHDKVPEAFASLRDQLGGLDRVVVNAGIGKGVSLGSGGVRPNTAIIETNLVSALVQIEAALELFGAAGAGHLVLISSIAGVKGLPGPWAAYGASKAGLRSLGESLRADYANGQIKVSVIDAGPIESEMYPQSEVPMFLKDNLTGSHALVRAIERERSRAVVPWLPWALTMPLLRMAPPQMLKRYT